MYRKDEAISILDLSELYQFVTYAECGTLSAAAEVLHISPPTLTRTMHHVEESFDAELFHRRKNRIELTETGQIAVSQAKALLKQAEQAVQSVQTFERSLHTITIHSCAPAPLWSLLPILSDRFPGNTISSTLIDIEDIIHHVVNKDADIGILPCDYAGQDLLHVPYVHEQLFVCVPPGHALEEESSLTFSQVNGFNCLLKDHIGFWADMVQQKMPASRFLVQTDNFAFE